MVRNLLVFAEPYVLLSIFIHPQILATDNIENEQILEGYEKKNAQRPSASSSGISMQTLLAIQNSVDENSLYLMRKPFA